MLWGPWPQPWGRGPCLCTLGLGRPQMPVAKGSRLFQTGLEPPPTPCSWCPLPWVGLQALSHGFGGGGNWPILLPILQAAEEILEGGQGRRPQGPGRESRLLGSCTPATLQGPGAQAPGRPCSVQLPRALAGLGLQCPLFRVGGPSLLWDPLRGKGEATAGSGSLGSQPLLSETHSSGRTARQLRRAVPGGLWGIRGGPLRPRQTASLTRCCSGMQCPEPLGEGWVPLREEPLSCQVAGGDSEVPGRSPPSFQLLMEIVLSCTEGLGLTPQAWETLGHAPPPAHLPLSDPAQDLSLGPEPHSSCPLSVGGQMGPAHQLSGGGAPGSWPGFSVSCSWSMKGRGGCHVPYPSASAFRGFSCPRLLW